MTDRDYASAPTAELVAMFGECARRFGYGRVLDRAARLRRASAPPIRQGKAVDADREEEVKRVSRELFSIAAALVLRDARTSIEGLYRADDPDIRVASALFLAGYDEESARAAQYSVISLLSTEEVLASRKLAREAPPSQPALKDLSDDALVAQFEASAKRQSAAGLLDWVTEAADTEARNRCCRDTIFALQELHARGLLARLEPYLDSSDLTVRYRAAQGFLPIAEARAVAALQTVIDAQNYNESISAQDVLQAWRNGRGFVRK
jgi:hypothetical protein